MSMLTVSLLGSVFLAMLMLFGLLYALVSWLVGPAKQDGQADKPMSGSEPT